MMSARSSERGTMGSPIHSAEASCMKSIAHCSSGATGPVDPADHVAESVCPPSSFGDRLDLPRSEAVARLPAQHALLERLPSRSAFVFGRPSHRVALHRPFRQDGVPRSTKSTSYGEASCSADTVSVESLRDVVGIFAKHKPGEIVGLGLRQSHLLLPASGPPRRSPQSA